MANLTKQHFDKQIKKLVSKQDLATQLAVQSKELKTYTDKKVEDLKTYTDQQTEKLARLIASAFQQEREYMDKRFNEIIKQLDVRKEVDELKQQMRRVFEAISL